MAEFRTGSGGVRRFTPKPEPVVGIDIPALGRSLVRAYMGGLDQYATFLLANETLVEGMSEQSLVGRLDARGPLHARSRSDTACAPRPRTALARSESSGCIGADQHASDCRWEASRGLKTRPGLLGRRSRSVSGSIRNWGSRARFGWPIGCHRRRTPTLAIASPSKYDLSHIRGVGCRRRHRVSHPAARF